MKLFFLLVTCCVICRYSFCQYRENRFGPEDLSSKTYNLKPRKEFLLPKLPFSAIRVIDARFDSSKLGFIESRAWFQGSREIFHRLKLKNGIAKNLENYYAGCISNSDTNGLGLLIVLKKFWLTSTRSYDYQKQSLSTLIKGESRMVAKWELYLFKNDQYLPFQRIDTTIESTQDVIELFKDETANIYNKESIYSILNNFLSRYDYSKAMKLFDSRAKKTFAEIEKSNNERFALPILLQDSIKNGIYKNFIEFKNNQPSITQFEEKSIKYSLSRSEEFLNDANNNRITNYWAYATKNYCRIGPYGNETIYRKGNSFEFFVKRRIVAANGNGGSGFTNHYYLWIPYQVDMETGAFY